MAGCAVRHSKPPLTDAFTNDHRQKRTTRVGALISPSSRLDWRHHTGGSLSIPTVHPRSLRGGSCGQLRTSHSSNHSSAICTALDESPHINIVFLLLMFLILLTFLTFFDFWIHFFLLVYIFHFLPWDFFFKNNFLRIIFFWLFFPFSFFVKTTPQITRFHDAKVCNNWPQMRIDDHRIQSDYKYKSELQNPEGKTSVLGIASAWWNRALHQWQRDHQDPEHFQHSAHEHWHVSAQFSCLLDRFVSSWFTHCTAWLKGVAHVISSMHGVCGSLSTLSPPFLSTSSSSHSSFISCSSSCTSSTSLRAVASLCTPPERVWTLLTTSTSSQVMSSTPTTPRRLTSSPSQSPWPPPVLQARVPRGRWVRWHHTRGYASRSTPSTCLSLPARRLVCRSVVVVHVRANGETRCGENRETCCGKWSGAKCWTRTD